MSENKRGQALTEFAIFGSILLFCAGALLQYGLYANYQQQVQMEAFRKAQRLAFDKTGPNSSVSLVLIKDKPLPDPRDQFGYAERYPVVSGANVVWDTNLSGEYVKKFPDLNNVETLPKTSDLPAMYFEVDVDAEKAEDGETRKANVPAGADENNVFGFYTAEFRMTRCLDSIMVLLPANGASYIKVPVRCADVRVMRLEGGFGETEVGTNITELLMYPFFRDGQGIKHKISDADVDRDGKFERVIGANQANQANKDLFLFYVDAHDRKPDNSSPIIGLSPVVSLGGDIQIDTDYMQIEPGDRVWDGTGWITDPSAKAKYRQGLVQDFSKTVWHRESQIIKEENAGSINSRTQLNAGQTVVHKIRLNGGGELEIPADFTVNAEKYKW